MVNALNDMAQLAIKGHATRGKEVIEILKMLGGKNRYHFKGDEDEWFVLNRNIQCSDILFDGKGFTLEEFLEKFPYKVGDKVCFSDNPHHYLTIMEIWWNDDCSDLECTFYEDNIDVSVSDLHPYKEETMEEIKIDIPKGYEFAGIDDNRQQVVFTKIQPEYPNTYKECFNICFGNKHHIVQVVGLDGLGDNKELFESFIKLKICRDAYWKLAGEQMGLGKSWKPDWENGLNKCCLTVCENRIIKSSLASANAILAFPTEEMRDAFYENFKELIELVKELL